MRHTRWSVTVGRLVETPSKKPGPELKLRSFFALGTRRAKRDFASLLTSDCRSARCAAIERGLRHEGRLSTVVVHLICNQGVVGSNPTAGTNEIKRLASKWRSIKNGGLQMGYKKVLELACEMARLNAGD